MIDFEKIVKSLDNQRAEVKDNELVAMFKKALKSLKAEDLTITDPRYKNRQHDVFYRLDIDGNSYCDITLLKDDDNLKFKVYHLLHKDFENRNKKLVFVFGTFMKTLSDEFKTVGNAEYNSTNNYFDSCYFTFKGGNTKTPEDILDKEAGEVTLAEFLNDFKHYFYCLRGMAKKQKKAKTKAINKDKDER